MVTITSRSWSSTTATLKAWHRGTNGHWRSVHGPVRVRLGWNGWVPAGQRRQNTGTTPAGRFTLPATFGNRVDPGARLPYTHVDGDDVLALQQRQGRRTTSPRANARAAGSHWHAD